MSLLSSQQDQEVMAEINITPFTDVLLVLLIIFMILAALVAPPGFEKELPNKNPNSSTQHKNKNDIEVDVNNKGVIFVDGEKTNESRNLPRDVRRREEEAAPPRFDHRRCEGAVRDHHSDPRCGEASRPRRRRLRHVIGV